MTARNWWYNQTIIKSKKDDKESTCEPSCEDRVKVSTKDHLYFCKVKEPWTLSPNRKMHEAFCHVEHCHHKNTAEKSNNCTRENASGVVWPCLRMIMSWQIRLVRFGFGLSSFLVTVVLLLLCFVWHAGLESFPSKSSFMFMVSVWSEHGSFSWFFCFKWRRWQVQEWQDLLLSSWWRFKRFIKSDMEEHDDSFSSSLL